MHIFNKAACGLPLLLSLMSTNGWATTLSEALSAAEKYGGFRDAAPRSEAEIWY